MRILFLAHHVWPHVGGVEKHVDRIAKELQRKGHVVRIISEKDPTSPRLRGTSIKYPKVKFLGLLYIWFWLFRNRNLIKNSDIIHVHDVFIWYLPLRFIYPNKKVYLTIHGGQGKWPIPFKDKLLVKIAAKLSNGTICVGDFIPKYFGIKANCVIYGGVDKIIKPKIQKEKLVIFLGRLEKDAGVYEFINKINTLRDKKYNNYKIEFVGDGSLRKLCEKYGVVHGFCDPTPFLEKASICFAGGYLSALEALEYGCELWTGADTPIKKDYWKMFPYDILPAQKSGASRLSEDDISVSIHPRKLRGILEVCYKKGDKLPTWKDISDIYESLYLHNN
ncbi:MAG: glycosyltransferase family 4 protein [Candidatus Woesebacteria bacterium]|nr:glycosyltransferase family 4 protein [Candidatus Woesebacteria bacterium]